MTLLRRLATAAALTAAIGALLDTLARSRTDTAALARERDALVADRRKLVHDMRGHLSPILMAAERLAEHADPSVSRMARLMLDRVDRASGQLRR